MLGSKAAARGAGSGIDGLAAAMLIAAVVATPIGAWSAIPAIVDPVVLLAGIGVGVASSVIPYVTDQLALARMRRSTYALLVALLPATATVVGVIVLAQVPTWLEIAGVALVIAGVAVHREPTTSRAGERPSSVSIPATRTRQGVSRRTPASGSPGPAGQIA